MSQKRKMKGKKREEEEAENRHEIERDLTQSQTMNGC